jgi:subtilisin family serine protease
MSLRRTRVLVALALGLGLVGGSAAAGYPVQAEGGPSLAVRAEGDAPLYPAADSRRARPGRYIVVFNPGTSERDLASAQGVARDPGSSVRREFRSAVKGFAGELSSRALARLRKNPRVAFIEADQRIEATATQSPVAWNLDRLDQRTRPLNSRYSYNATGAGVAAYVIDSGIRTDHREFGNRATEGFSVINDGRGARDCNGHGTHVAGTIGGSTYGVAKGVTLVAVRVLACDGSGTVSGAVAGVDWVTRHHQARSVANISFGTGLSSALDNAVAASIASGVPYVVAAGNEAASACGSSPGRVSAAITIGATTPTDQRASFSNYGPCVDLFAPGVNIRSGTFGSTTATALASGTSMAAPHATGAAALYLQSNPGSTPAQVRAGLVGFATANVLGGVGAGSPNKLLYSTYVAATSLPSCSALPETYTGTLAPGGSAYQPNGGSYFSATGGFQRACLSGPAGANFDLFLHWWNGSTWVLWGSGRTSSSTEEVRLYGGPGHYLWGVSALSGGGNYTLKMTRQ